MQDRLKERSIFFRIETLILLLVYIGIRVASYVLFGHSIFQALLVFILMMILGIAYFKNEHYAWLILLAEFFLGGTGHFLEFFGLSVRTALVCTFLFLWAVFTLSDPVKKKQIKPPHRLFLSFIPLFFFVAFSSLNGLFHGHPYLYVVQDALPFLFLLLALPSYHLFNDQGMQDYMVRLAAVFIMGTALFSLLFFILYASGVQQIHDPLYQWFRDVAMGKITEVTPYFVRIVAPEHLLITPSILIILSLLMRDEKHHAMWRVLLSLGLLVLALNFSRAYLLGFFIGILILVYKHKALKWLKESTYAIIIMVFLFGSVNAVMSKGKSFGLEIVGIRIGSLVEPYIEESSRTRLALLPPIMKMIRQAPLLGQGLGASVSFSDPKDFTLIRSRQFDWGYLEMIAEFGSLGTLWFFVITALIVTELIKKIECIADYHDFKVGLLGGIISMLIINITSPALFHAVSMFALSFVVAFVTRPVELFDDTVSLLYQIFNKRKKQEV